METKGLSPTSENIAYCAEIIASGGLVAFPTETVYGLGANGLDPIAIKKIYKAKGRPSDNPMIFHVASPLHLEALAKIITKEMEALILSFWPGPLTLVVEKKSIVPLVATGGLNTVAVRMPNNAVALELIERAECPIAAPSANLSGRPSPTRYQDVWEDMGGRIDAILEGDDCQVGIESTVVDMTIPGQLAILRPGAISAKDIKDAFAKFNIKDVNVIGENKIQFQEDQGINVDSKLNRSLNIPKAPGMKYKHYAPKGELIIVEGEKLKVENKLEWLKKETEKQQKSNGEMKKVAILFLGERKPEEMAHDFFARLRELDRENIDVILAGAITEAEGEEGIGPAVMNRMLKAAGYRVIKA